MTRWIKILGILTLTASFLPAYSLTQVDLEAGYDSNILENSDQQSSVYAAPEIFMREILFPSENQVVFLESKIQVKKYLSFKQEDVLNPSGMIKWRFKGQNQVFDLSLRGYYENLWNDSEYTFYRLSLNPEYRYDFERFSLFAGGEAGWTQYPSYDFDRVSLKGYLKSSLDVTWKLSIHLSAGAEEEFFTDHYLLNSSFVNTSEKMNRTILSAQTGFEYLATPNFSLQGFGGIERHHSQGNYYFYGPNEDTLVVDGDELLFPDYYSKTQWEAGLSFDWQFSFGSWGVLGSFGNEVYDSRYPLDSSGAPVMNQTLETRRLTVGTEIRIFLEDQDYVSLEYRYQRKFSNDATEDTSIHQTGIKLSLFF